MATPASFDAGWLALREPFDRAARAAAGFGPALAATLAARVPGAGSGSVPVEGLDLGGGTGALLRCLLPALGEGQHWQLVDADPALLAAAPAAFARWAAAAGHDCRVDATTATLAGPGWSGRVALRAADLSDGLPDALLDTSRGPVTVVAASALLDLVSAAWVEGLVRRCRARGTVLACSLNYDGRIEWTPPIAFDARATRALNRDQVRDKGFGVALGPTAADALRAALADAGLRCWSTRSDWVVAGTDRSMQQRLLDDLTRLARDEDPAALAAWRAARAAAIAAGASQLRVGHVDVIGGG